MSDLLDELLARPVSAYQKRDRAPSFTKRLEISGSDASVEMTGQLGEVDESLARQVLLERGEDPSRWVATGFESSDRELASGGTLSSFKFKFARIGTRSAQLAQAESVPAIDWNRIEDEIAALPAPTVKRATGTHGYLVLIADGQYAKADGDGVEGAIRRSVKCIDQARADLEFLRQRYDIGHVEVSFLGDMQEGMVSQGGANIFRTTLAPGEQLRLVRRIMLHAMKVFADSAETVSFVAVPGNHDQTYRVNGKGATTYDDSYDVEALIGLSDHAKDSPALEHIQFFTPERDEMTVVTEVAGTVVGHAHGHQWRPGKHFEWWKGQSFGGSPLADADLLVVGHLHHEHMDSDGRRLFLQAPSLESESTWFRHSTGSYGHPGIMTAITKDGITSHVEVVR